MNGSELDTQNIALVSWVWIDSNSSDHPAAASTPLQAPKAPRFDLLRPVRHWLDQLEVRDAKFAHSVCKLIPSQCPFERDIKVLGRTILHIPPMCKLNPLYEEVVGLRFRALCYLADVCGEDVTQYC